MYTLFRNAPSRTSGVYVFPELSYIRRMYAEQIEDVKAYYARAPKPVNAKNLFGNILLHYQIRMDLDDYAFSRMIEDKSDALIKAFGLTATNSRGKVFQSGVTLGEKTSEVVIATYEPFDMTDLKKNWRKLTPVRYLYHSRTNLDLPIMNNTTPAKGYGITVVNLPMLAVMYRYWLRWQANADQKEVVYRFIGSCVLPNAIDSFLDIAFFNRMARASLGIGTPNHASPHPFYLTDLTPRVDRVINAYHEQSLQRTKDLEQLAWATPMLVKDNLFQLAAIPREPVTRQNEWAISLARLPYVKFLVNRVKQASGTDRSQLNDVKIALLEARWDSVLSTINDAELVEQFKTQVDQLTKLLN